MVRAHLTTCVSSIDLTRKIACVINILLLPVQGLAGSGYSGVAQRSGIKKFLAESSRVELPAKEIAAMPFGVRGKRGERLTRFLEKSQMNFSIQSNTGAL